MWKILKFGISILVILALLLTLFSYTGTIPDTKAVAGSELSSKAMKNLLEAELISEYEKIHYFYSEDVFSFVDYGNLFTDSRVISYEIDLDTDQRIIHTARYPEISDIIFVKSEGILDDSVIEIYVDEQHSFSLVVSSEENGDNLFYKKLLKVWKENL